MNEVGHCIRRLASNVMLATIAVAVALIVAEIAVRAFAPRTSFSMSVNAWDPVVGTKQIPGAHGFVISPDCETDLDINSKGLRDWDYAYTKPSGVRRLLCLGDSYTCGYGVALDETFAKVLERLLSDSADSLGAWEVINAGVGSTGTAHQLAYFETEGYRYDPDLVVLCFCEANDFSDNRRSQLYALRDGQLVKQRAPRTSMRGVQAILRTIPGYATLARKSQLLALVGAKAARLHYGQLARWERHRAAAQSDSSSHEEFTSKLLLRLRDACTQHGARLLMMVVPLPGAADHKPLTRQLIEFARAHNITLVDLKSCFEAEERRTGVNLYRRDRHWNPRGHELVAGALYGFLQDRIRLEE
jgi:lysophospholipase L1-like esterase